jgi:hypothetical protein
MLAVPKLSWRELIIDKLLSLPPEELHRIGAEVGLIQAGEVVAPGEVATLLLRRAASKHMEDELVTAVSRSLSLEAPPD